MKSTNTWIRGSITIKKCNGGMESKAGNKIP